MRETGYNVAPMDADYFYKLLEEIERDEERRMEQFNREHN